MAPYKGPKRRFEHRRWCRIVQDITDASALRDRWRHPRRGWARPAEDALCESCGADWSDQATDCTSWGGRRAANSLLGALRGLRPTRFSPHVAGESVSRHAAARLFYAGDPRRVSEPRCERRMRARVGAARGTDSATVIVACAVGVVARVAARPVCSVLGRGGVVGIACVAFWGSAAVRHLVALRRRRRASPASGMVGGDSSEGDVLRIAASAGIRVAVWCKECLRGRLGRR